jgi:signal transduction histidine kinase
VLKTSGVALSLINAATDVFRSKPQFIDRFRASCRNISLAQQFVVLAAIAVGCVVALLSTWVSGRIKQDVLHHSAASNAVFVNSVVAPLVQGLATRNELDRQAIASLDAWHNDTALGKHVITTKIWRADGTIVYSNRAEYIGRTYSGASQFIRALNGAAVAKFAELNDAEHELEHRLGVPLLELFSPIREQGTDRIIAVAEIYRLAAPLDSDLHIARQQTWYVVGAITLGMISLLYIVVHRGSRTIRSQQTAINQQTEEMDQLRALNNQLTWSLAEFRVSASDRYEQFLRRVGTDLHQGPAQHVAFALLKIDALRPSLAAAKVKSSELEKLRMVLQESLGEIRNAASGFFFPPELQDATITETVQLAVRMHERRTETRVHCKIDESPARVSLRCRICIYRFIQEGLTNAYHHAGGVDQQVRVSCDGIRISIEVADKGPGCSPDAMQTKGGIGLACLRDRVESLGGVFFIDSKPGSGTRLRSILFVADPGTKDV